MESAAAGVNAGCHGIGRLAAKRCLLFVNHAATSDAGCLVSVAGTGPTEPSIPAVAEAAGGAADAPRAPRPSADILIKARLEFRPFVCFMRLFFGPTLMVSVVR